MMLFPIISFLAPLAAAYAAISYLWHGRPPLGYRILLKVSLSVGLAFGLSSCLFFIRLRMAGPPTPAYLMAETGFLLLIALIFGYALHRETGKMPADIAPPENRRIHLFLLSAFGFAVLSSAIMFVAKYLYLPHGAWDAWTIWNQRARFFFRGWERWSEIFAHYKDYPHLDYPLMLPLTIARAWSYLGRETTVVPAAIALVFAFATVFLMWSSVSHFKGRSQGVMAALTLTAVPYYVAQAAWQYADVPMGCLVLSVFVLFALGEEAGEDHRSFAALAGMMTGLAAWLKNEGILILLCILIARMIVVISSEGMKAYIPEILSFAKGLLPILAIIAYFKLTFAPPNDLVSGQGSATWKRLTDLSRYMVVAEYYAKYLLSVVKLQIIIFPAAWFLLGLSEKKGYKMTVRTAIFAIVLILGGYFMVYVTTPKDIASHLQTSYKRLLLHVLPGAIFAFFLALASPEERKSVS